MSPPPAEGRTPIVLVSGPPASGKTHVAELLSDSLHLPLVAKDRIKEALYDTLGTGDVAWSQRLGKAAVDVLYQSLEAHLRARQPLVVEANFAVEQARPTLLRLGERYPFAAFEVHCTAEDDVLVARYTARSGSRHAGHLDAQRVEEITAAIVERRNAALELGETTLVLDTTHVDAVDVAAVADAARRHLVGHGWRPPHPE